MNAVKLLETIGQQTSIKQYNSTEEMLNHIDIDEELIPFVKQKSLELVCGIYPDRDDPDKEEEEEEEEEK